MRRGEIWIVDLEPVIGSESDKARPALIVSNDHANAAAERSGGGTVTVVPLTSNLSRVLPFQAALPKSATGLATGSKAQAEQIRAVSPRRLRRRVGLVPHDLMSDVDDALRLHLRL